MCSNASITEILGINDNNLVILGNEKENTRTDKIPMCFRKSIKTLKKLRKYVVNSLKYDYTTCFFRKADVTKT